MYTVALLRLLFVKRKNANGNLVAPRPPSPVPCLPTPSRTLAIGSTGGHVGRTRSPTRSPRLRCSGRGPTAPPCDTGRGNTLLDNALVIHHPLHTRTRPRTYEQTPRCPSQLGGRIGRPCFGQTRAIFIHREYATTAQNLHKTSPDVQAPVKLMPPPLTAIE